MNLRILKKLSKVAAPILVQLGDTREQFNAGKCEAFIVTTGHDRKHWERHRARYPLDLRGDIKFRPKNGSDWIVMREPSYALKGTVMVGWMSGYYEPEWEERSAWCALVEWLLDYYFEFDEQTGQAYCSRDLRTTEKILYAARDAIASKGPGK